MTTEPLFRDHYWRTPAVRHLAWLLTSPAWLADDERTVLPLQAETITAALLDLNRAPEPLLSCLQERPSRRLGVYFEQLYRFALEHFMECDLILQNQPVRDAQRTIGELDFIVRRRRDALFEHHEIAVKFYLGFVPSQAAADWWGPDSRDRLSHKLDRLLSHQSRLSEHLPARTLLQHHGIDQVRPRICLRGYLFHPIGDRPLPPLPPGMGSQYPQGYWLTLDDAQQHPCPIDALRVPVYKPDWLGPIQLAADMDGSDVPAYSQLLTRIEEREHPLLFADLKRTAGGFWLERSRFFVVPRAWPHLTGD